MPESEVDKISHVDLKDESLESAILNRERRKDRIQQISSVQGVSARTPIYGVLTEPLQGVLRSDI